MRMDRTALKCKHGDRSAGSTMLGSRKVWVLRFGVPSDWETDAARGVPGAWETIMASEYQVPGKALSGTADEQLFAQTPHL